MTSPLRKARVEVTRSTSRSSSPVRPWKRSGAGCSFAFVVAIDSPGGFTDARESARVPGGRANPHRDSTRTARTRPLIRPAEACVIKVTDVVAPFGGYCQGARGSCAFQGDIEDQEMKDEPVCFRGE